MSGRTDSERMELARQCVKIERSGGNVIEFLKKNGAPYTPSATWHNLQKYYLKRRADQMTTGIPKEEKRKEDPEMEKGRMTRIDSRTMAEEIASVAILSGGDPVEHLREMGYANPTQKWKQLRAVMQEKNPDLLEQMDLALAARQEKKDTHSESQKGPQEHAKPRTEECPSEAPETTHYQNGAETARDFLRKITTCCAPARESGVTVPDEIPEPSEESLEKPKTRIRIEQTSDHTAFILEKELEMPKEPEKPAEPENAKKPAETDLRIRSVESDAGTFMISSRPVGGLKHIVSMSYVSSDQCSTVNLTPEEWGILLATAPKALRMLGLIK